MMVLYFVLLFLLVILSGVFSLFNSAIDLCRKTRLEKELAARSAAGKRGAKSFKAVLEILENPDSVKWSGGRSLTLACRINGNILKVTAVFFGVLCLPFFNSSPIMMASSFYIEGFYPNLAPTNLMIILFIIAFALISGLFITLLSDALPVIISRTMPEKIAAFLLPVIKVLSVPMLPFTLPAMKFSTFFKTVFRPETDDSGITEEELQDELRNTLLEGEKSGIVESKERSMVEGVFYLGDRPVGAFMTHRSEIQWLDINAPYNEIMEKAVEYRTQRCFPVVDGSPDEIAGAVYLEDIIIDQSQPSPHGLRAIMKKAQFVPETMTALKAFESFKQGQVDFLFVMDEYGGLAGIISIRALVEEIVGELSAPVTNDLPLTQLEDGSYLADGTLNIDDAAKALGLTGLPEEDDFHTLAGFVLHLAGELPSVGDSYEYQGYRFRVVDKDGNRIDKLMISKI